MFVNDKKVFYRSLAGSKGGSASFDAAAPLKKGTNVITLIVRTDNEVSARRTLVIHREGETDTAARPALDNGTKTR